jgi:SAM-dependent methyltransferase
VANVVCAQSFHWFSEKENLESIRRVLAPGGKLILIWNMKQFDLDWMTAYFEQLKHIETKLGRSLRHLVNTSEWRQDIDVSQDFKFLWHKSLPGTNFHGDLEAILANISTISAYNILPVEERDVYIDTLRQTIKNWPGLDINNMTMPFTTELYVYVAQ